MGKKLTKTNAALLLSVALSISACSSGSNSNSAIAETSEDLATPNETDEENVDLVDEQESEYAILPLRDFLPDCSMPRNVMELDYAFDYQLFFAEETLYSKVSLIDQELNQLVYEISEVTGEWSVVPINPVIDHFSKGRVYASPVGSVYYLSGLGIASESALQTYDFSTDSVVDIPSPANTSFLSTGELLSIGNTVYFTAETTQGSPDSGVVDSEVWSFDTQTELFQQHQVAPKEEMLGFPSNLMAVGGSLIFSGYDDESTPNFYVLKPGEITPRAFTDTIPNLTQLDNLTAAGDMVYFTAYVDFEFMLLSYEPGTDTTQVIQAMNSLRLLNDNSSNRLHADGDYLYWIDLSVESLYKFTRFELSSLVSTEYIVEREFSQINGFDVVNNNIVVTFRNDVSISDAVSSQVDMLIIDTNNAEATTLDVVDSDVGRVNRLYSTGNHALVSLIGQFDVPNSTNVDPFFSTRTSYLLSMDFDCQ